MPTTYVTDYTALTDGFWRWNGAADLGTPVTVSYCFLETDELPTLDELRPFEPTEINNYTAMDAAREAATRQALVEFSSVSGLQFVEVDDPNLANIHLLSNFGSGAYSWAFFPYATQGYSAVAEVVITEDLTYHYDSDWLAGGWAFTILLHELGHAMGLDHPHEGTVLDPSIDNFNYTIMSYDWTWDGTVAPNYDLRATLGPLDVDALQYLYGSQSFADLGWVTSWDEATDVFGLRGGSSGDVLIGLPAASHIHGGGGNDTIYGQGANDQLRGQGGHDMLLGADGADILFGGNGGDVLNGGTGFDRAQYSDATAGVRADLDNANVNTGFAAGDDYISIEGLFGSRFNDDLRGDGRANILWGYDGHDRLDGRGGHDRLFGGNGSDTLLGGTGNDLLEGGNGHDRLVGGSGRDRLEGGNADDRLIGGADGDTFIFENGFGDDLITDFDVAQQGERLSLRDVSAITNFADLQANHMSQSGNHTLIDDGRGNTITLIGIDMQDLNANDFIF